MRVLLSTYGSRGDVEPLVGLAAALRALGAEVRICAPPDEEFTALIESVGASPVPAGPTARELTAKVKPGSKDAARLISAELVAMRFGMLEAASDCDALLATGLGPAGAREVAERVGIPYVFAAFQPRVLPSPHHAPHPRPGRPFPPGETDNRVLWEIDAENVNAMMGGPLNEHRAAMGLPPVDDVRGHIFTDRPWLAADPILAPWPQTPGYDVVQTGAWTLPGERPLPDELEAFLDAGEPPVYVGFGSMPVHVLKGTAEAVASAVRAQGRRLLVSRGWADLGLIDTDDHDCFAVGETDHRALFGRVAAVVHHGGAGTTTTAARSGAAQVVVPQIADQPYWAERVADLGVGATPEGTPTFASLSAAIETALAPQTRARAEALAERMRPDGATVAARLLLDLAR